MVEVCKVQPKSVCSALDFLHNKHLFWTKQLKQAALPSQILLSNVSFVPACKHAPLCCSDAFECFSFLLPDVNYTKLNRKAVSEFQQQYWERCKKARFCLVFTLKQQHPQLTAPSSLPLQSDTNICTPVEIQQNWQHCWLCMIPPDPASCTSATTAMQHQEFMKIPVFSSGLHLHCLRPNSWDNHISEGRYPGDPEESQNISTQCHHLQKTKHSVTESQLIQCSVNLLRLEIPGHEQLQNSTQLVGKHLKLKYPKLVSSKERTMGLMEIPCRLHSAHNLIAEPYFHKQREKLLNTVSKNLSVQEEMCSKECLVKSFSFLIGSKWNL